MNKISMTLATLLVTASAGAMAADVPTTTTTRDQRMNTALQDYRNGQTADRTTDGRTPGRMERTEDSVKRNSKKAGHAVAEGARDAGHAVAQGARKTGHAIHKGADKVTGKDATAP